MTLASTILLASFPLLINLYADRDRQQDKLRAFPDDPINLGLPRKETFDFVIVGGGTAGCVLARRIADAGHSVVLLEAGGTPPPLQSVPILSKFGDEMEAINFLYRSQPQEKAALEKGGRLFTPAGKMLGGSSSHNDMMYERGSPKNFDEWASLTGDKSWEYSNFLQYFLKAERYMGKFSLRDGQHNPFGMASVSRQNYAPGRDLWLEAGKERGYGVHDANGPQRIGFSPNEFSKRNGRRESTYTAYIKDIENRRKTLSIRRYSVVSQVIIEDKEAKGVIYERHGIPSVVFANKEVILSAGAYVSPLILIKSGIGPLDELQKANVTPVSVLPVGHNLMDHPFLTISPIYLKDPSLAWQMEQNLTFEDFDTFLDKGDGPLATSYLVGVAETFYASSRAVKKEKRPDWADLQVYYGYFGDEKNAVTCYIGFNRPYSRGRLTLNTSATSMEDVNLPIIDYKYFDDESDLDVVIEGLNFCLDTIEKTKTYQKVGATYPESNKLPQCAQYTWRSNDYWKCHVKQQIDSTYHASGVCRMGKKDDPRSVVDSKLKVIGVNRLRVVDAGIMPVVTNANTAAPTVAIAEKAADDIIKEHRRFPFP